VANTVIIAGSLAQRPFQGGHTWVFLQYLLGFKRLGWEVLFLDRLEPEMCVDEAGRQVGPEDSANLRYFLRVMERFGLGNAFALFYNRGEQVIGLSRQQVVEWAREAAFMLNVMGYFDDEEVMAAVPRRVFLDIDPGFGQMWQDLGLHDLFRGHDDFVTIGENIGQPECKIPTCGLEWITTPQPVVLEEWPVQDEPVDGPITSVMSWRGPFGPIEYRGQTYGLRVHEFRKFLELSRRSGQPFLVALDIHPAEVNDIALLEENGWFMVNPRKVAGDPWSYREFIQGSRAEFMVAKGLYVKTQGGWFSDRSICYLASGKPVLAQDTGIATLYPTGEGLLTFTTLEEALFGVEEISRNHSRHSRAARALAEEYFDSDKVLSRLLSKLSV
jgi:hypothetical protein